MYRLIVLLLVLIPGSLAHATAITDLPGFTAINVCFLFHPGLTLCEGPTKQELLSQQFSFNLSGQPIPIFGGLGDQNGDLGKGHEFFVLGLPQGGSLDSVTLVFGGPPNTTFENANTITLAAVDFAPGFSINDLPKALGPSDTNYVQLRRGTLVFGFASSAPVITPPPELTPEPVPEPPTPVPEPATLTLLVVGGFVLKLATHKRREGRGRQQFDESGNEVPTANRP
jgi:hypothetical protein